MKEIKITEKTTKQGFVNILKEYLESNVTDKNLSDRIKYALDQFAKDMTKVAKSDLRELAEEVVKSITPAPAPVEASLKPKKSSGKKSAETTEAVAEETPAKETAEAEETPKAEKKPAKKTLTKSKEKKPEVESLPAASNVGADHLPSAKIFPAEIDHPELGKLIACSGAYTTYAEVIKALEEDKTLYFACYWTKRQIREYQYAENYMVKPEVVKNGFPLDLDIAMAVLPCETMERLYAMSRITEAMYRFEGHDFQYIEDTDPRSGDKFQIRVSSGMEYEIYRPAEEEIAQ